MRIAIVSMATLALVASGTTACGPISSSSGGSATGWVDQEVSFQAGGMTLYGTFRHPTSHSAPVPAALIIAGSGPTDRNGNSALAPGPIDTLQTLAGWLSTDGVASLRYDKLGTGDTGLGPYASNPNAIGLGVYEQEAAAALNFLAKQPGVDRDRLAVFGHSEGALFALLLATGAAGSTPPVHALGLLEPASLRSLDTLTNQIDARVAAQLQAGQITAAQAAQIRAVAANAIQSVRTTGTVQPNLPYGLSTALAPSSARFLSQEDRHDPAQLAAQLKPHLPVLVSCSDADTQITCAEVNHLASGLEQPPAATDFVHLNGVDHVLKEDPSMNVANYVKPLPFSSQLQQDVKSFARSHL